MTSPVDTAIANASAPNFRTATSAWTQANVSGGWFAAPGTAWNGYAAYAGAMGLPTTSVVSSIPTLKRS